MDDIHQFGKGPSSEPHGPIPDHHDEKLSSSEPIAASGLDDRPTRFRDARGRFAAIRPKTPRRRRKRQSRSKSPVPDREISKAVTLQDKVDTQPPVDTDNIQSQEDPTAKLAPESEIPPIEGHQASSTYKFHERFCP
jgi:hypothetical protein